MELGTQPLRRDRAKPRQKLLLRLGRGPWRQIFAHGRFGQAGILAEQALRFGFGKACQMRGFEIGRAAVGGLDRLRDGRRPVPAAGRSGYGSPPAGASPPPCSRRRCTALNGEIMSPMTYSGASCSSAASRNLRSTRGICSRSTASTSSVCCATEKICAPLVWPFQRATRARPWAISAISISSGEGSSRSSRRPDSIRCQARVETSDDFRVVI